MIGLLRPPIVTSTVGIDRSLTLISFVSSLQSGKMIGSTCYHSAVVVDQFLKKPMSNGDLFVVENDYPDIFYRNSPGDRIIAACIIGIRRFLIIARDFDDKLSEFHGQIGRIAEI